MLPQNNLLQYLNKIPGIIGKLIRLGGFRVGLHLSLEILILDMGELSFVENSPKQSVKNSGLSVVLKARGTCSNTHSKR
jgi:hypothetical protein